MYNRDKGEKAMDIKINYLEIENIKSDDTFKTISNLENWDEYFEELKNELKVEEKRLEDESKVILEENT